MCDNMERFFYQAWKEASLPLPPGAGPSLRRARPKDPKGHPPAWQDEQQAGRGTKRQRTDTHYEVNTIRTLLSDVLLQMCTCRYAPAL